MTIITQKDLGTGNFGKLAEAYKNGRRGVPDEVIDYLWSMFSTNRPMILDVGCGTGIPTRQLAERGAQVSATDIDADMIKAAQEDIEVVTNLIEYKVAPAGQLPFADSVFDVVTIFSAFHWFTDCLPEIRRVLKPQGIIFVVNKNDDPNFLDGRREILKRFIGAEIPNSKTNYNPQQVLQNGGFTAITTEYFMASEFYTLDEMIVYVQSTSVWNLIPEKSRPAALAALREHYSKQLINGLIERKVKIVVQKGIKE